VVTPEPTSITDAYALMKTLPVRDGGIQFRLLANRCRNAEEGLALYKKLSMLTGRFLEVSMEYAGCILQDEMLVQAVTRRGPVCRLFPDSRSALGFRALANKVMSEGEADLLQMQIDQMAANKQWRNHELSS
jgi:flagellar biosynthesis protein FlhG